LKMGNTIDKRAHFEGGYLYVKTDRPYYYSGNVVYGKIYIRSHVSMLPRQVIIRVKGTEKASYEEDEGSGEERKRVYRKHESKLFDFRGPCFNFTGALNAGDY